MVKEKRVVITGIGPLASIGTGKEAFWEGILNRRVGIKLHNIELDGEIWDKFYFHKIENFNINDFSFEEGILDDIRIWKKGDEDKDLFYLLAAVKLAIDDSGISYDKEQNDIGLFLTIEHPGFESFCEKLIKETIANIEKYSSSDSISKHTLYKDIYKQLARNGYDLQTFMYLYFISKAFGVHGYSLFTNNACASGLYALESAVRQIKYGGSEVVIVAGGDSPGSMFKHMWFKDQGIYAEDGKMKPFSVNADGLVLGEGASALILEDMEHALNRKAHIYAEYLGGGFTLEGWKVTMPQIGGHSYHKVIESSLNNSNLKSMDIDIINPHGVAIKATDAYEARAISNIFSRNPRKPHVTAFKPYVGHNLGGSALLESIILLLSLEHNTVLPTLNCDDAEPRYGIDITRQLTSHPLNTAMKLSCGFAGYNAAVIFRKVKD